jgi:2-oxoisovalerate dehydrogenase E1 component beta subunit
MPRITLIEAVTMALAWEMEHDDRVVVLGEDVGVNGGVFRATAGLQQRFGADRVMDTPLAESMIAGMSVGMAAQGMRPVAEIQFMGFIYPTVDMMINHAGRCGTAPAAACTCRWCCARPSAAASTRRSTTPRAPRRSSPHARHARGHSLSPRRAYGLLLAAIRDPDPVVFLEPKRIYRLQKQEVEDNGEALPLDTCYILREGDDVTLVTWGAMTFETLKAAEELDKEGISAEVIDLATISPMDLDTILESVEKTGRLVIVHEAASTCGVGAEVAAGVAEKGIWDLKAPIVRVTGYDTVMPLFRLEYEYLPSVARIIDGVKKTFED